MGLKLSSPPVSDVPYRNGAGTVRSTADGAAIGTMRFCTETLGLNEAAFTLLRDLIHQATGQFFDASKRDLLADKLSPLLVGLGFTSFLDYYYLLKYDTAAAPAEWARVADALSVPETYFWREHDQVKALIEHIIPEHFARTPHGPLRIWSAACCSGEEPLTLALALQESGWLDRGQVKITASDASPAAISRARRGLYRERSFRTLPPKLRARHFTEENGEWRVDPRLHAWVRFEVANLLDAEAVARLASAHVIFCRNVFIYFSPESIRQTVDRFHARMAAPGHLFVGASESLLKITNDFDLSEVGGAFVYLKKEKS